MDEGREDEDLVQQSTEPNPCLLISTTRRSLTLITTVPRQIFSSSDTRAHCVHRESEVLNNVEMEMQT